MFTQNQVRQFYVAKNYASGLTNAGDTYIGTQLNDVYFNVVNADGQIMRTDLIDKNKVMSVTFTPADAMKYTSKATYITVSNDVKDSNNSNKPYAGQDYILNIKINQLNWHSDETYGWKYGVVHTTASMDESDFYKTLAKSLVANLSRDPEQLLKVYAVTATGQTAATFDWASTGNYKEIKADSDVATGDTFYAVIVDEAEQEWKLGTLTQDPVYYEAKSDDINVAGDDIKWGVETEIAGNTTIGNGKKIADMEWFYHGERGDIYREGAWPNNWPDKMLANPSSEYGTLDIHYYWNGANHAVQKSEKDITIALLPAASGIVAAVKSAFDISDGTFAYSATGTPKTVVME